MFTVTVKSFAVKPFHLLSKVASVLVDVADTGLPKTLFIASSILADINAAVSPVMILIS